MTPVHCRLRHNLLDKKMLHHRLPLQFHGAQQHDKITIRDIHSLTALLCPPETPITPQIQPLQRNMGTRETINHHKNGTVYPLNME